jgi:hypothetical protein
MRTIIMACLILALGSAAADARRYHYHRHGWGHVARSWGAPAYMKPPSLSRRGAARNYARIPPPDWQLQPADPNWSGRRYVSPEGDAWLAFYATPTSQDNFAEHVKTVAFAEGEEVLNLNADRRGVLVSGTKGERMFVRQARLACDDRTWHHIALEFPAGAQRAYANVITAAMSVLASSDNEGCDTPTASNDR